MTGGASPKRKGDSFERDVVACLRANGHPNAERAYGAGRPDDTGDVDGISGWALECKNCRAIDLAGWTAEAATEATHGPQGTRWAVIAKRRGKRAEAAYVVIDLHTFAGLIAKEMS